MVEHRAASGWWRPFPMAIGRQPPSSPPCVTTGSPRAVVFNYPPEVLEADPGMVGWNTVNLANGITPQAPDEQFASIDRPFGLWIGKSDELFVPEKVVAFGALAERARAESVSAVVPGETHLGILVDAADFMGPWLVERSR